MDASKNPDTHLWLIRHPEPAAAAEGRCYGSLDIGLSTNGARQAHAIAAALADERFSAIYTSPRRRCTETARILRGACPCPVQEVDALREMDFGSFEGRSYDEIAALYPDLYRQWMLHPTQVQFPGGENFSQMSTRVLEATGRLVERHQGESIAFLTHGGVIRIILADVLGMPSKNIFRIGQRYGALNLIRYAEGFPIVELINSQTTPRS
jgi:alpha-ribazole phosphatase